MTKPQDPEVAIRRAFDAGEFEEAATLTLHAYGREISGFIVSRLRGRVADTREVFSMFTEDLWTGLPEFGWRCALRTWCYALARNAAVRYTVAQGRRAARHRDLETSQLWALADEQVRTETSAYQKTAVKDRFRELRDQLDIDDQMLLVLRVDKGLSWRDLAIALNGDANLSQDELARESARLRKAFERVKGQLRRLAEQEGLLTAEPE